MSTNDSRCAFSESHVGVNQESGNSTLIQSCKNVVANQLGASVIPSIKHFRSDPAHLCARADCRARRSNQRINRPIRSKTQLS